MNNSKYGKLRKPLKQWGAVASKGGKSCRKEQMIMRLMARAHAILDTQPSPQNERRLMRRPDAVLSIARLSGTLSVERRNRATLQLNEAVNCSIKASGGVPKTV